MGYFMSYLSRRKGFAMMRIKQQFAKNLIPSAFKSSKPLRQRKFTKKELAAVNRRLMAEFDAIPQPTDEELHWISLMNKYERRSNEILMLIKKSNAFSIWELKAHLAAKDYFPAFGKGFSSDKISPDYARSIKSVCVTLVKCIHAHKFLVSPADDRYIIQLYGESANMSFDLDTWKVINVTKREDIRYPSLWRWLIYKAYLFLTGLSS